MARNGIESTDWWAKRWYRWLDELGISAEGASARAQVRGSRVQRLEVKIGSIAAKVRDRDMGECRCFIEVAPLNDAEWELAIGMLGEQALYAAQLLAGDMPPEIETVFRDAGIALLPPSLDQLEHSCDCCTDATGETVCRPLHATYLALGEMLIDDPWLLFRLRGRDREQILRDLRELRSRSAGNGQSLMSALSQPQIAEEPAIYRVDKPDRAEGEIPSLPLSEEIDHFWGASKPLREFHHHVAPPSIELVALRRLGLPPLKQDSETVYQGLVDVYQRTTDAAVTVAYAAEEEDDATEHGEEVNY
jgi:uncharacterized Zn finger protein